MVALGLIPLCSLPLLFFAVRRRCRSSAEAFLCALICWGGAIVLLTEVLSIPRLIRWPWLTAIWLALAVGLGAWLMQNRRPRPEEFREGLRAYLKGGTAFRVAVGAVAALTLLIALTAAPNTWDSMTYHMSRVANWAQNGTVRHYPTDIPRQLFMGPFAEFAVLHFQVLSGGDWFANLVQWLSMAGCLIGVALLARDFGAGRRTAAWCALFAATLPTGILQSHSTQTDYVVTLWLVCFVYFALMDLRRADAFDSARAGLALGLALLTKATAYFFALPFLFWYLLGVLRRRPRRLPRTAAVVLGLALVLNLGHWRRNVGWFGTPLAPQQERHQQLNARFGPGVTLSNFVRNASLQFSGVPVVRRTVAAGVRNFHQALGLGVNETDSTARYSPAYHLPLHGKVTSEDYSGNPLHFLMAVLCVVLLAARRDVPQRKALLAHLGLIACGYVLLCAALRWDPFRQRLYFPLFVLAAPAVGLTAAKVMGRRAVKVLGWTLVAAALPYLLSSATRPLFPIPGLSRAPSVIVTSRPGEYFAVRPGLEGQYREAVRSLRDSPCRNVGIVTGSDDWEYPLWALLGRGERDFRIVHPHAARERGRALQRPPCATFYLGAGRKWRPPEPAETARSWDYLSLVLRRASGTGGPQQ